MPSIQGRKALGRINIYQINWLFSFLSVCFCSMSNHIVMRLYALLSAVMGWGLWGLGLLLNPLPPGWVQHTHVALTFPSDCFITASLVCLSFPGRRNAVFLKAVNQVRNNSFSLAKQCWFGVEFWCKATGEVGCEVPLKCSLSYIVSHGKSFLDFILVW